MKTSSKAVIWILIVFLTGILFGGTVTFLILWTGPHPLAFGFMGKPGFRPPRPPEEVLRSMADRFDLDEEQQKKLLVILEESRDQFRLHSETTRQEFIRIRESARSRIRAILEPHQVEKLDEFLEKRRGDSRHWGRSPESGRGHHRGDGGKPEHSPE
jgi:hypothetical protein